MKISLRVAPSALLMSLAMTSFSQAASLNSADGFNAVVLGNHNTSGGDTEGRLAVQGDMSVNGSYSVGGCSSPDCKIQFSPASSQPQSNGARTDLVVGGNLTNSGSVTVNWDQPAGNVVAGGAIDPTISITSSGSGNTVSGNVGDVSAVFDFLTAGAALRNASIALSNLVVDPGQMGTVTIDQNFQLALVGTDADLNVFNVTQAQWASAGFGKSREISAPEGARLLINVAGQIVTPVSGTMSFGAVGCSFSASCLDPTLFAPNLMVNYFEATSVSLTQFAHEGSFLAPLAQLSADGGFINGQTIVGSTSTRTGFEFHFRDNNGADFSDLVNAGPSPVPLPAALPLLGAALFGLAGLRARRSARKG